MSSREMEEQVLSVVWTCSACRGARAEEHAWGMGPFKLRPAASTAGWSVWGGAGGGTLSQQWPLGPIEEEQPFTSRALLSWNCVVHQGNLLSNM